MHTSEILDKPYEAWMQNEGFDGAGIDLILKIHIQETHIQFKVFWVQQGLECSF